MPSVPLGIKLRASLLKNNIASHPEYGFLPSIFEHVDFLGSSIWEMQSWDCPMICTQILLDLHRTFDTSWPEHIQFANLLNYHVTYLRAKIVEFIQSHTADKEKQRGGLTYYAMFIDSVLTLLLRIPTIRNISIRLDPEDPKTTLWALDYWISEQEKNKILLHNLWNQDNLKVSSPLIFPGIQADGSYIFPPHPTIQ